MHTLLSHSSIGMSALCMALAIGCASSDKQGGDSAAGNSGDGSGSGGDGGDGGGGDGSVDTSTDDPPTPTVVSNAPLADAIDVPLNIAASVEFSEEMDEHTLTPTSFYLASGGPPVRVDGTVIYADATAVFWPSAHLDERTAYTATVTIDASSALSAPLAEDHSWTFTTGETLAPGLPVELGTSGDFVILSKSGISSVPTSAIVGDIGVSPAAATYITGFSLAADATNTFSTSPQVVGKVYAANYADPTPALLTAAVSDMERAFTDAGGRAPDETELGAGNIGGMTLEPGVYKWGTGLLIPTDVTLSGSATDVWIFQIAQDLTVESGARVLLSGGAQADNIFWQVSGLVDIGTTAHVEGNVVTSTSLSMRSGATLNGRLLAQTAVVLDGGTVTLP